MQNYFSYPQYPNYMNNYQQNFQPQQPTDERIWVQGEESAKAYLVTANGFVRLWDSTKPVFYEKRADQTGRPYMEYYEYKRIEPNDSLFNNKATIDYTEQLKALEKRITALETRGNDDVQQSNGNDTAV